MTVKELIAHLSTMPPDVPVIYRCCSEYEELNVEEVELSVPLAEPQERGKSTIFRRNGRYMDWHSFYKDDPKDQEFVICCCFPGN